MVDPGRFYRRVGNLHPPPRQSKTLKPLDYQPVKCSETMLEVNRLRTKVVRAGLAINLATSARFVFKQV